MVNLDHYPVSVVEQQQQQQMNPPPFHMGDGPKPIIYKIVGGMNVNLPGHHFGRVLWF